MSRVICTACKGAGYFTQSKSKSANKHALDRQKERFNVCSVCKGKGYLIKE
ncbi:MAG: hypothetical protein ABFD07_16140 [Methanobacterium sp.]